MKVPLRPAVIIAAASMAVSLAACGKAGDSGEGASSDGNTKIGLLLPEDQTPRYEQFDKPLIEKKIKELCGDCTLEYANAKDDIATQKRQVDTMIVNGVEVLIVGCVNCASIRSSVSAAHDADIPVVAYDRLAEGPISAYVSFDSEEVGRIQGEQLLEAMGDKADGGQIVWVSTLPPADNPSVRSVLAGKVKIETYRIHSLTAEAARAGMSDAIAALGPENIDGVFALTDLVASGVITALKAARIEPLPPVTGQDAELAAVQRIVRGEQYMSVYKPFKPEADAAAGIAVALGRGQEIDDLAKDKVSSPTTKDIPAVLLPPIALTVDNIKDTVVKDRVYTIDQICTPKLRPACEGAGLVR